MERMTLGDLVREAYEAAEWRGHFMSTPPEGALDAASRVSTCRRCGRIVVIDPSPPPNGSVLGGEALAVHCTTPKRSK